MKQMIRRAVSAITNVGNSYEPEFVDIWRKCEPFTMTSIERAHGLWLACNYAVKAGIYGDFVECGVWRGGSAMIMAHTLLELGEARPLYLYDTYEGMTEPTDLDVSRSGESAHVTWLSKGRKWCDAGYDEVAQNMASTGYPMELVRLVKGRVEQTLPESEHAEIALLRLDTDWYESTALELNALYPKLVRGGVLIIDDYGHWRGSQKAVDEYFNGSLLLTRMDYTGRMAVKV